MVTDRSVCLLIRGNPPAEVLLGLKKTGFGSGKYTGLGGKIEEGETLTAAAAREIEEESGLRVAEKDLNHAGRLTFLFPAKPEWSQVVEIFRVNEWRGEARETVEMKPAWFALGKIPYDRMWPDASHWLPRVLRGDNIRMRFVYGDDNITIREISEE